MRAIREVVTIRTDLPCGHNKALMHCDQILAFAPFAPAAAQSAGCAPVLGWNYDYVLECRACKATMSRHDWEHATKGGAF